MSVCERECKNLALCLEISSDNVSRMFRNRLVMLAFYSVKSRQSHEILALLEVLHQSTKDCDRIMAHIWYS